LIPVVTFIGGDGVGGIDDRPGNSALHHKLFLTAGIGRQCNSGKSNLVRRFQRTPVAGQTSDNEGGCYNSGGQIIDDAHASQRYAVRIGDGNRKEAAAVQWNRGGIETLGR
jgi:hypothetical protein